MTYHNSALGDIDGTYVQWGRGDANFTVSGLNGTPADSEKARTKILAMVKAIPGVASADAAWKAGGTIAVTFRATAGTPVNGTAAAIRRNAAGVGAQIHSGVTVTVTRTGFTASDIVRDAPAATPDVPAVTDAPPTPTSYAPPEPTSMPIWPLALGGGVLVLGAAAFFLLRKKKPATQLTVRAA